MSDLAEQLINAEDERKKICRKYLSGRNNQIIDQWVRNQALFTLIQLINDIL
jgi:hypothetical protein